MEPWERNAELTVAYPRTCLEQLLRKVTQRKQQEGVGEKEASPTLWSRIHRGTFTTENRTEVQ